MISGIEANEKLVQPGKIAIIYSQEKEAKEYVNYIYYLQSINYVGRDIEWLTLSDLQEITGLKALRVEVIHNKSFTGVKQSKAVEVLEEINQGKPRASIMILTSTDYMFCR